MLKDSNIPSDGDTLIRSLLLNRERLTRGSVEASAGLELKISGQVRELANWLTQVIRQEKFSQVVDLSDGISRWIGERLARRAEVFKHYQAIRKDNEHKATNPLAYLMSLLKYIGIKKAKPELVYQPVVDGYMIDPALEGATYGCSSSAWVNPERAAASEMVLLLALKNLLTNNLEIDPRAKVRLLSILADSFATSHYYCQEQDPLLQELVLYEPVCEPLAKLLSEQFGFYDDEAAIADRRRFISLSSLISTSTQIKTVQAELESLCIYGVSEQAHLIPLALLHCAKNPKASLTRTEVKEILSLAKNKLAEVEAREAENGIDFDGDLERLGDALKALVLELDKDLKLLN